MVKVILSMSCGCSTALADDGERLVACSVDVCRDHWWCECVTAEDPEEVCEHALALRAAVAASAGNFKIF